MAIQRERPVYDYFWADVRGDAERKASPSPEKLEKNMEAADGSLPKKLEIKTEAVGESVAL